MSASVQPKGRKYRPTASLPLVHMPSASSTAATAAAASTTASMAQRDFESGSPVGIVDDEGDMETYTGRGNGGGHTVGAGANRSGSSQFTRLSYSPFGAHHLHGGRSHRYGSNAEDAAVRAAGSFSPTLWLSSERVIRFPSWCPCFVGGDEDSLGSPDSDSALRVDAVERVARLGAPSVLAILLGGAAMLLVNVAFVGHARAAGFPASEVESPTLLAGVALGASIMLLSGWCVVGGMCSCIDTLCSQAHGAGKQRLVGLIAQRAAVCFTLLLLPLIALVWLFTESALLLANQDASLAAIAGQYTRASLPCLAPLLYSEIIRRYLLAQSGTTPSAQRHSASNWLGGSSATMSARARHVSKWPQLIVPLMANILHAAYCAASLLFPRSSGVPLLGPREAAAALVLGQGGQLFFWMVYLLVANRRLAKATCPRPWSFLAVSRLLRGWGPLLRLGVPGLFSGAAQAGALLFVLLAAGWLRDPTAADAVDASSSSLPLDSLVVLSALASLSSTCAAGVGLAAGNIVATSLGGERAQDARHVARASGVIAAGLALAEFLLLLLAPALLASAFSAEQRVQESFVALSPAPALLLAADTLAGVQAGVLRGLGLQSFAAHAALACYVLVGLPLGLLAAFPLGFGARGLAWGLVLAGGTFASLCAWRMAALDWEHECSLAQQRILEEEGGGNEAAELFAADSDIEDADADEDDEDHTRMRREHGFFEHY